MCNSNSVQKYIVFIRKTIIYAWFVRLSVDSARDLSNNMAEKLSDTPLLLALPSHFTRYYTALAFPWTHGTQSVSMVNELGNRISIMSWSLTLTASEMILKLIIEILIIFGE